MKSENLKNKKKARKLIKQLIKKYGDLFDSHYYLLNKNSGFSLKQVKALENLLERVPMRREISSIGTAMTNSGWGDNLVYRIVFRDHQKRKYLTYWSDIDVDSMVDTDGNINSFGFRGCEHWHAARHLLNELSKGEEGEWYYEESNMW